MHTQITYPPGHAALTTERMLNALDDEGAAPAEVSVKHDRLAYARDDRNLHKGIDLVPLIFFWLVEE